MVNQDPVLGNFLIEICVDLWGLANERRCQGADLQQGTDRQKFGNTIATSNSEPRTDVSG